MIPCSSERSPQELEADENSSNTVANDASFMQQTSSGVVSTVNGKEKDSDESCSNRQEETLRKNAHDEEDPYKMIESLKTKMCKLEDRLDSEVYKCPICMGPYVDPVISINCWHASCSGCWLRVLGAKKLCPKCNEIVTPSQLRKIFL